MERLTCHIEASASLTRTDRLAVFFQSCTQARCGAFTFRRGTTLDVQAVRCRRRHQPRRPTLANLAKRYEANTRFLLSFVVLLLGLVLVGLLLGVSNYLWEVSPNTILSLIFAAAILFLLYLAARGRLHKGHWAEDQLEKKKSKD